MDIKLQVALLSGLVGSLIGVLVTMWQVRKQFETSAELQRRENRIPVMQKLWAQLQPLSFHGKPQNERSDILNQWKNIYAMTNVCRIRRGASRLLHVALGRMDSES